MDPKYYQALTQAFAVTKAQFEDDSEQLWPVLITCQEVGLQMNAIDDTFDPEQFYADCNLADEIKADMEK